MFYKKETNEDADSLITKEAIFISMLLNSFGLGIENPGKMPSIVMLKCIR